MKDILFVAKTHIVTALRERVTLFWFLIFPVFLLTILVLILGHVGNEGEISFDITLINHDLEPGNAGSFSSVIEAVFLEISQSGIEGIEPLFTLHRPKESSDPERFLSSERTELRRGRRAAILVIPEGFSETVLATLAGDSAPIADAPRLHLFMSDSNVASVYASQIIQQVLTEVDRRILIDSGSFDPDRAVVSQTHWLGRADEETLYVDFVLPGIVLMGFFINGLFGVPGTILFNRDLKVLRRYWVTPLSVRRYLSGFALGHLTLCVVQFLLLYSLGVFVFGATISFASWESVGLLVLSAMTFLAFGFLIASLAKTPGGGMATANILNMPMMFLSGLFFPTSGLPPFILVLVYANPVTYLLEGLRRSVGVQRTTLMPVIWILLVPLLWTLLSVFVTTRKLKWDVER